MNKVHKMKKTLFLVWVFILLISICFIYKYVKTYLESNFIYSIAQTNSTIMNYINDQENNGYSILVNNTFGKNNLYSYAKNVNTDKENMKINTESNCIDLISVSEQNPVEFNFDKSNVYFKNYNYDFFNKDYFLSNGKLSFTKMNNHFLINEVVSNTNSGIVNNSELEINFLHGDLFIEDDIKNTNIDEIDAIATLKSFDGVKFKLKQLNDFNFLIRNFYIVDETTVPTEKLFDAKVLLSKDMKMKQNNSKPQILIYHTHSQETYIDSKKGKQNDTVVGVGKYLKKILEDDYGYNVMHDTSSYDMANGYIDRNKAYNYAEAGVSKILKENPSIEVVIDLHRDARNKRSTSIDGKECAQIMLFNGLSRDKKGPITYLDNPNLSDNLAFSLQLQIKSLEKYPGLFYKNYLKYLRFNLHLRPKSLLIELGTENNSLQSAKNSMVYLAEILDDVFKGK